MHFRRCNFVSTIKSITLIRRFSFFLVLFPSILLAQKNEFGVGVGAFNYAGDLMRGYHIENAKPGLVAYYKRNLDNIFSARGSLTGGWLSGTDENPIDPFAAQRAGSFHSGLIEAAAMMEYNFLDFKAEHVRVRWSPYMFVGLGTFVFFGGDQDLQGSSRVQMALPFGGGIKYAVNPNIILNLEVGIRKLFFDTIDGYSDGDITNKNYQYGNKYDTDWYNFVGISISYIFWDIPCPYDFY